MENRRATLTAILADSPITPDRFIRVVVQTIAKNESLRTCDRNSVLLSIMEAAQLGLEPTGVLGYAYLVPYKGRATLVVGYRGLIDLVRRSGLVDQIEARIRYENDDFALRLGTSPTIDHTPVIDGERGAPAGAYMVAHVRGAPYPYIEYMTLAELEDIRKRTRARDKDGNVVGPWATDTMEMYRKTVVRRGMKYLPLTPIVDRALSWEDDAEAETPPTAANPTPEPAADAFVERLAHAAVVSPDGPGDTGQDEVVSDDGGEFGDGLPPLPA